MVFHRVLCSAQFYSHYILLNSNKTEVLILGPKHLRDILSNDIAALDHIALASNETVKNF